MKVTSSDAILADVDAFCQQLRPGEDLCYLEHRFNDQLIRLAQQHNILALIVPQQYGGRAAGAVTYSRALERIGREGTGVRTFFSGHTSIGQYPILRFGNDAQRQKYLPPSATGECILAFGLTEPDAGSNPLEMTSTYRREGDLFLLNGVKYLISNGGIAHAVIVFAYPEDAQGANVRHGERRVTAFIVETSGDTFESEDITAKPGMHTSNTAMFEMCDHPVPLENMLGDEGDGFRIAMRTLISGRLSVAAGCVGVIEDCLDEALEFARTREQHGKPIGRHQLIQRHLAEIEILLSTSRLMVDRAARAKQAHDEDPESAERLVKADLRVAEAKYHAAGASWKAADHAVQIFGGRGWSELYRVGRHLQDTRVCRIYEGTDEIMQMKIASSLLGPGYSAFH